MKAGAGISRSISNSMAYLVARRMAISSSLQQRVTTYLHALHRHVNLAAYATLGINNMSLYLSCWRAPMSGVEKQTMA